GGKAYTLPEQSHFQSSRDTRRMWQGIQSITNYRPAPPACDRDASLPDALNNFYARFEAQNGMTARKTIPPPEDQVLCLTTANVRNTLCRVNPWKAAGPDIPGRVLRECAEQLADVFTDIFNISLSSAIVPKCLKTTTIIPVPKKSPVSCLNDYHPVALRPIIMKCFERPQSVRIGNSTSSTTTLNTGVPQGYMLSPLLFTLLTHDCAAIHNSNHIIKFADNTTVMDLITTSQHTERRFNVKIIKSTKFLGVHLAEDLAWSLNTSSITRKAQQRLYFLRRLRKAHLPPPNLTTFYRETIESIPSSCITAWFGNCTVSDCKTLQWIVRTAEKIIEVYLSSIMDIYSTRCIRKANSIVDDPTHPSHTLFTLLPSGKSDTVSKPYSMADLTTVLYTFPLILADIF
ncbi:hypothetical protein QTP70_018114, partial [Hemibagrus guttatus]